MSYPNAIEVCRTELFTKVEDLQQKYPQTLVDKVVRVREMYNWFLSNPGGTDREFVSEVMQRHSVSKVTAYSDLAVVKTLMPMLASASRDFHRWRFNEISLKDMFARRFPDFFQPATADEAFQVKIVLSLRHNTFCFATKLPLYIRRRKDNKKSAAKCHA
ncbi:MAG: hypothetical protein ACI30M_05105 [Muribaculaceae bacterium]